MIDNAKLERLELTKIDYGARAREEYKGIDELAQNIRKHGLIHPIVVVDKRKVTDIDNYKEVKGVTLREDKPYLLLAGGRRLTAFRSAQFSDTIPSKIHDQEINLEQVLSIELYENVDRESLTWQEKTRLKKKIHDLWTSVNPKTDGRGGGHTLQDTADMFNETRQNTSFDIKLAEAMDKMPGLEEFKTKKEAMNALKNLERVDKKEKSIKEVEKSLGKVPPKRDRETKTLDQKTEEKEQWQKKAKKKLADSYILGDFFEKTENSQSDLYHFIDLDPPYGIDLHKQKGGSSSNRLTYNEIEAEEYPDFLHRVFKRCKKLLHPHGWLLSWVPLHPWAVELKQVLDDLDLTYKFMPIVWHKGYGQTLNKKKNLSSNYEMAVYIRKGPAIIKKMGRSNVYEFRPVPHQYKIHPTERPISLMEELLDTFAEPGNKCLIPFAGSGNTLLAAANKHIISIGYDLSDEYQIGFKDKVYKGGYGEYQDPYKENRES